LMHAYILYWEGQKASADGCRYTFPAAKVLVPTVEFSSKSGTSGGSDTLFDRNAPR
jgi:hypothetical protein